MDTIKLNSEWPEYLKGCSQLPGIPNLEVTCFANCALQVLNHTPAFVNYFASYSCKKLLCAKNKREVVCECRQTNENKEDYYEVEKREINLSDKKKVYGQEINQNCVKDKVREENKDYNVKADGNTEKDYQSDEVSIRETSLDDKQNNSEGVDVRQNLINGEQSESENDDEECYHCLMKEYIEHLEECQKNNTDIASGKFLNAVMKHTTQMRVDRMSDSEEFFMHLENKLEDEYKNSVLWEIFHTKLAEVYRCKQCRHERRVSKTEQLYLIKGGSVTDKLAELTGEKDCDVKRTCEKCRGKRDFTEKTVVERPPHVLQIRMKSASWRDRRTSEFPEFLNIRPYLESPGSSDVVYKLYAVVVLSGVHYFAHCRAPNGQWNRCNDDDVTVASSEDALAADPFSLYYARSPELDERWEEVDEEQGKKREKKKSASNLPIGRSSRPYFQSFDKN